MNNRLFKESILYGNLEIIYSERTIKKVNFAEFYKQIKNFRFDEENIFRFMANLNYLINFNDVTILNNIEKAEIILAIFDFMIKSNQLDQESLDTITINDTIKLVICHIIYSFDFKVSQYVGIYKPVETIKKKLLIKYSKIIDFVGKNTIIFDHFSPFEENIWTSSWKIFFGEKSKILKHIDTYLDNIFVYNNIKFSGAMQNEIKVLNRRIQYLKDKTIEYYHIYIKDCVEVLTERIFNTFPLQIIFNDYLDLIKNHKEVYKPDIFKYISMEDVNENNWIFIILPDFLIAYLLGYPVISSDVPSIKNMSNRIKNFDLETYFKDIAININQKLLNLMCHDIPFGNGVDPDDDTIITDVLYERIIDYNYDDTFMIFDNGTTFVFTCPEYKRLRTNEKNPYNSTQLSRIQPMIINQKTKNKFTRYLYNRGIKIDLTSTMYNNFEDLKKCLKQEFEEDKNELVSDFTYDSIIHNPIFQMVIQGDFFGGM
jgi:hypothetical protein